MSGTYHFRFTLGQWQCVVAVLAVCFAALAFELAGQYGYLMARSYGVFIAGVGVLLYNVRLSRWMWVVIAGYAGPLLLGMLVPLASMQIAFSLLYVLGLAVTLRDVRRGLEGCENPM
jgi:hypothetical protein